MGILTCLNIIEKGNWEKNMILEVLGIRNGQQKYTEMGGEMKKKYGT